MHNKTKTITFTKTTHTQPNYVEFKETHKNATNIKTKTHTNTNKTNNNKSTNIKQTQLTKHKKTNNSNNNNNKRNNTYTK